MASKLKLVAAPTFTAKVDIPIAGGAPEPVVFTFRHRTKKALDEFIKSRADRSDVDSCLEMVAGWDLEDAFTKENVELLFENHIGAALAIYLTYVEELTKAKAKN